MFQLEGDPDSLLFPGSASSNRRLRSGSFTYEEELFYKQEEELEWPPEEIRRQSSKRNRHISVNSIGSILTSISQTPQLNSTMSTKGNFHLLMKDVSKASWSAWAYLFFSETAGMSLSVIILCGTKFLKEHWDFSPSQAAFTIVLPQLLVIPVFCLVSLWRFDNFACVIFGNAFISLVALLPFLRSPVGWSCTIFCCELFNAMRTSSQMPGFNLLVPSPRIARRFISISTVFIFALRTIGYSGGTALYEVNPTLPFVICGASQIVASLILCFLLWWDIPQIVETRRVRAFEENLKKPTDYGSSGTTASPRSVGSRGNEHNET